MSLQPIGNKILVLPDEPKNQSGSLVLIQNDQPKTQGTVVDVGGRVRHVTQGDKIIFERMEAYDPGRVDVDGVPHFLMAEEKVIGLIGDFGGEG
jgi:co-chaperonin GroES (HSP10)